MVTSAPSGDELKISRNSSNPARVVPSARYQTGPGHVFCPPDGKSTVVLTDAVLSDGSVSVVACPTVAVLVIVPGWPARVTTVTVVVAPTAIPPSPHNTV